MTFNAELLTRIKENSTHQFLKLNHGIDAEHPEVTIALTADLPGIAEAMGIEVNAIKSKLWDFYQSMLSQTTQGFLLAKDYQHFMEYVEKGLVAVSIAFGPGTDEYEVVGMAKVDPYESNGIKIAEVGSVITHPAYRKHRLGLHSVVACLDIINQQGLLEKDYWPIAVVNDTNVPSFRLFESKLGAKKLNVWPAPVPPSPDVDGQPVNEHCFDLAVLAMNTDQVKLLLQLFEYAEI